MLYYQHGHDKEKRNDQYTWMLHFMGAASGILESAGRRQLDVYSSAARYLVTGIYDFISGCYRTCKGHTAYFRRLENSRLLPAMRDPHLHQLGRVYLCHQFRTCAGCQPRLLSGADHRDGSRCPCIS